VAGGDPVWSTFSLGHARQQRCAQQPNARRQARRVAGARDERRLFAVACKPLLGCWRLTRVLRLPGDRLPPPTWVLPWPPETTTPGGSWARTADAAGTGVEGACCHRARHDHPGARCLRGWPGAAESRGCLLPPRQPQAPAARPRTGQETPTRPKGRRQRHPTPPRPCSQCQGRDAGPRRTRERQRGLANDTRHATAGA